MPKDQAEEPRLNSKIDVDHDVLAEVLDKLSNEKREVSESAGKLRSSINGVIEKEGWHKTALAQIRTIDDMSETKRADFLRSFIPMFEALLENRWADQMTDMLSGAETGGDE